MPIYYVIMEMKRIPGVYISVWDILKVISCDLEDASGIYDKEVGPLQYGTGRQIQTMCFYREPANPLQEKVQVE
jgi:hypothetical protein